MDDEAPRVIDRVFPQEVACAGFGFEKDAEVFAFGGVSVCKELVVSDDRFIEVDEVDRVLE